MTLKDKSVHLQVARRACQHSQGTSMRINQTRPHLKVIMLLMLMLVIIITMIMLVPTFVPQFSPSSWAAFSERPLATRLPGATALVVIALILSTVFFS